MGKLSWGHFVWVQWCFCNDKDDSEAESESTSPKRPILALPALHSW